MSDFLDDYLIDSVGSNRGGDLSKGIRGKVNIAKLRAKGDAIVAKKRKEDLDYIYGKIDNAKTTREAMRYYSDALNAGILNPTDLELVRVRSSDRVAIIKQMKDRVIAEKKKKKDEEKNDGTEVVIPPSGITKPTFGVAPVSPESKAPVAPVSTPTRSSAKPVPQPKAPVKPKSILPTVGIAGVQKIPETKYKIPTRGRFNFVKYRQHVNANYEKQKSRYNTVFQ